MALIIEDDIAATAGNKAVYAGNLSYETTDAQVLELFSTYGEVVSATVEMRGRRSMGYAIVTFANEADAKYAIDQCDEQEFGGRKLRARFDRGSSVKAAAPKAPREPRAKRGGAPTEDKIVVPSKVFVMNLSYDSTAEDLEAHCGGFGEVASVDMLTRGKDQRPVGSAIVEFAADESATAAIQGLEGTELGGRPLRVREYYQ
jgi:nucleolin